MAVSDVAAPPRLTPRVWLLGGALAVFVPPIVMGIATQSVAFGIGYLPLLLLWAGVPQSVAWLFSRTLLYRRLPQATRAVSVVVVWAVGGAAVGAVVPFLTANRLAGAAIGTVIAVVLLSSANLVARAATQADARRLRVGVLVALATLIVVLALLVVPYQW